MTLYLPIAELSVNWLVIVGLGALVGFLSGMFGVGGGFLTTPLLIFYGIPPAVAVASSATQITGASVSGALAYWRRGGVDFKMGGVLVAGGFVGAGLGSLLFSWLQGLGQNRRDDQRRLRRAPRHGRRVDAARVGPDAAAHRQGHAPAAPPPAQPGHRRAAVEDALLQVRASTSRRSHRSVLGAIVGILTVSLGIGGGFIMVPAMIYLLGMATNTVLGTSLFQIIFVTAATTLLHSTGSHTVDIVLAGLLLIGGVVGAQLGVRAAGKLSPVRLRLGLALLVLGVAVRLAIGLALTPAELFSVFGPA